MVGDFLAQEDQRVAVITGYAGTGKCQPLTSIVYTPSGPKKMGDVVVGEFVCTPRGSRSEVSGVYPQGVKEVWRFWFDDGTHADSTEEHIWRVLDRQRLNYDTNVRDYDTRFIVDHVNKDRGDHRFYIPTTEAVDFDARVLPIDPYLLGLLLGDGSIGPHGVMLTSKDEVIIAECESLCLREGVYPRHSTRYDYRLTSLWNLPGRSTSASAFYNKFKALGLWGRRSALKFVPRDYLLSSKKDRTAVLQGLMDTDGTVDKKTGMASFCTTSPQLAKDVQFLAESLGGKVTISTKLPWCNYKGRRSYGKQAYILFIGLNRTGKLFRLERKRSLAKTRTKYQTQRCIRRAESLGPMPVQCLLIDDPEHMYLTDSFIPTHNTTLIRQLADTYKEPLVLTPTGKAALRVGEATGIFGMTIHRFLYVPSEDPKSGAPIFKLKDSWHEDFAGMDGRYVLVDEASMVARDVWADLLRTAERARFHIILMGDLFQLPPVLEKDGTPFSTLAIETPFKTNLDEVIRQALDSPIVRASMLLRTGRPEYEATALINPIGASRLIESVVESRARGGATICFTNARRHDINNRVRTALGFAPGTLNAGEPLLVIQNNYDLNVYNGEIIDFRGWATPPCEPFVVTDRFTTSSLRMGFGVTTYNDSEAVMSPEQVTGAAANAKVGNWIVRKTARGWYRNKFDRKDAAPHLDASYGYALTGHKSQGSEWPEVLVVLDDSLSVLSTIERRRWLYTVFTRAKHTLNFVYLKERLS